MTVVELKEKLIEKINSVDDEVQLEQIALMIDVGSKLNDGIYEMSAEEIKAVKEGIEQIENGEWITNEEANRRTDELFRSWK